MSPRCWVVAVLAAIALAYIGLWLVDDHRRQYPDASWSEPYGVDFV